MPLAGPSERPAQMCGREQRDPPEISLRTPVPEPTCQALQSNCSAQSAYDPRDFPALTLAHSSVSPFPLSPSRAISNTLVLVLVLVLVTRNSHSPTLRLLGMGGSAASFALFGCTAARRPRQQAGCFSSTTGFARVVSRNNPRHTTEERRASHLPLSPFRTHSALLYLSTRMRLAESPNLLTIIPTSHTVSSSYRNIQILVFVGEQSIMHSFHALATFISLARTFIAFDNL